MADVKISALPASTTPLAGTEVLPIVQSSTTRQVSVANLTAGRAVNALSITASSLTSGRITYAGTAGLLQDSGNLTYNGTTLTITGGESLTGVLNLSGVNQMHQLSGHNFVQGDANTTYLYGGANGGQIRTANNGSILWDWSDAGLFNWYASGGIKMTLDASGNLLVGTTSAVNSSKFLVAGVSSANSPVIQGSASAGAYLNFFNNAQTTGSIQIGQGFGSGSDNVGYLSNNSNADFVFATNGTERMRIESGGSVKLKAGNLYWDEVGTRYISNVGDSSSNINIQSRGYTTFSIGGATVGAGTERMRIDSSGNLLVNTTSAVTTTIGSRLMAGTTDPFISSTLTASSDATTSYLLYSTGAAAYRFYVGLGGTIFATSIVISAISDQRLKENIRDIDTGLSTIMALKPRRFDWKEGKGQDKKNAAGFIAQEYQEVLPNSISTFKQGDDGIDYLTMNHEELIPTLVKAIQELKAEFDAYKTTHP